MLRGYARRRLQAGERYRPRPTHEDGFKTCAACDPVKPVSEFHRARSQSGGYNCYCKPCRAERDREKRFLREYGLTPSAYDALIEQQGGLCALCRERPAEHVDHDHVMGTVRGVLCFPCNAAPGQLKDRVDLLHRAIDYLKTTHGSRPRSARASTGSLHRAGQRVVHRVPRSCSA